MYNMYIINYIAYQLSSSGGAVYTVSSTYFSFYKNLTFDSQFLKIINFDIFCLNIYIYLYYCS